MTFGRNVWLRVSIAVLLIVAPLAWLLHMRMPSEPDLPGSLDKGELTWAGYSRSFTYYKPANLADDPALVFVFHGSRGNSDQSRSVFGYAFEQLAEQHGFIVVFPDGYEDHWNGCRKAGPYQANTLNIDDVGYMRALVDRFVNQQGVDRRAVFATGISNGGQMALRLALEAPDLVAAVAPVATNLPTDDNMDCAASGQPVAVLLMNGTNDPMNPYGGGTVALFGLFGDRGTVLSSMDTVSYWADLAGHEKPPIEVYLGDPVTEDGSHVVLRMWQSSGKKPVALYTIVGGGHNAPHPHIKFPMLLGGSNNDIVAAEEIWNFFQQNLPLD